ncbi:quinoprotein dehydrogenase-associated SoxYZ-like carrier [Azospirillum sp. SYSU D00513]|uniref:quinoprotein dehydrogenase-associated SoxYZ-like carrier n=1 Tax=Azospirillum sp. SYSU D00513 TaxID=2812561 RepID=UPI001A96C110|nr:quinoprotein dehydrogenase-associated SoxYZ-like carrier [Azospirillum sp. SYSU D00513]
MNAFPKSLRAALLTGVLAVLTAMPALAAAPPSTKKEDVERWEVLRNDFYAGRAIEEAGDLIALDAPTRAHDAAIVPIRVDVKPQARLKSLSLFIDGNPVPHAATVHFGPASAGGFIETRVRVDSYTNVRAVGETEDGQLLMTAAYVKAAGGCSAPALKDPKEALNRLGKMRLRQAEAPVGGGPVTTQLLIAHPNNSGFQFDQISRTYIPAHYLDTVTVTLDGKTVLDIDTDISISEDPSFSFGIDPAAGGTLQVVARDSKNQEFTGSWPTGGRPAL